MALLKYKGGTYEVTAEDRLWLARAVQAEGPVRADVARALVNLFAYLRSTGRHAGTLAALVRAYAQPVNPRWYEAGDLHLKAYNAAKSDIDAAKLLELARKREQLHSTRVTFSNETKRAVENALTGGYFGDVTDYAAPTVDATSKGMQPRSAAVPGKNRLWTRAVGWAGYLVDSNAAPAVALLLTVLALAALFKRG